MELSTATIGAQHTRPRTIIQASGGWRTLDVRELWQYRELLYFLAWRDVKVRYKQTALGAAWAVLQPLLAMAVFTIVFGRLAGMPSDGMPYALFAYVGLLPWTFFANAVAAAGSSLVANSNLVSKVYFPRLLVPLAAVCGGLVDLAIGLGVLVGVMAIAQVGFGWHTLLVFPFVGLTFLTAVGVATWLSAIDVRYRDVRYVVPFLLQVWLFATPVVYPSSIIPPSYRALYGLNPMAGIIEGFRWAVTGRGSASGEMLALSTVVVLVLLVSGLLYFRRVERAFADVI